MSVIEISREERPRQCDCCSAIAPGYLIRAGYLEYHGCDDCFHDADHANDDFQSFARRRESVYRQLNFALFQFREQGLEPKRIILGRELYARLELERAGRPSIESALGIPIESTERRGVLEVY